MEHQAHVQADADVGDLSAKFKGRSAAAGKRSEKPVVVSWSAVPDGCGDGARHCASVWWAAGREDWRAERQAVSTAEYLGAGELSNQRHRSLRGGPRRFAPPPQHVHLCEAHGASA